MHTLFGLVGLIWELIVFVFRTSTILAKTVAYIVVPVTIGVLLIMLTGDKK